MSLDSGTLVYYCNGCGRYHACYTRHSLYHTCPHCNDKTQLSVFTEEPAKIAAQFLNTEAEKGETCKKES